MWWCDRYNICIVSDIFLPLVTCKMLSGMIIRVFLFQAEDGIRVLVRSRGFGDVYKRQLQVTRCIGVKHVKKSIVLVVWMKDHTQQTPLATACLLYTSDAADERSSVDLGGRRIIKKKRTRNHKGGRTMKRK